MTAVGEVGLGLTLDAQVCALCHGPAPTALSGSQKRRLMRDTLVEVAFVLLALRGLLLRVTTDPALLAAAGRCDHLLVGLSAAWQAAS